MVEFSTHAPGVPSWVDLMSPDVDSSKAFYQSLFGWDAEDRFDDEGNRIYVLFSLGGRATAGLGGGDPSMGSMPAVWNTYVTVTDVEETAEAVTSAGGSVLMPPMTVMEAGEMAVLSDPAGAAFSIWKPNTHIGVELGNEPNTFSWSELLSRDLDRAMAFYSDVFGWTYDAVSMDDNSVYNVVLGGENGGLAGLMPMPAEMPQDMPSFWMTYFLSAELDASIAQAISLGGTVVNGPMDVPDVGRLATVVDPQGATFSLMQPVAGPAPV